MIQNSGIGRVLYETLLYLLDNGDEWILIGNPEFLKQLPGKRNTIVASHAPAFHPREFVGFPRRIINSADVFFTPNYNIPGGIRVPIVASILDLVYFDLPEIIRSPIGRWIRRYFARRAVRLSREIITISEFTRERIEYYLKPGVPIHVCYLGITRELRNQRADFLRGPRPYDFPYILYIGNVKRHKNLHVLLEAYLTARKNDFNCKLVIVGKMEGLRTRDAGIMREFAQLEKQGDIITSGYVPDNELYGLMAHTEVLIQPSLYEGFGLPPLEALYLGRPVVLSDIPIFREVYSDLPVTFFDPLSVRQLSAILENHSWETPTSIDTTLKSRELDYAAAAEKIYTVLKKYAG